MCSVMWHELCHVCEAVRGCRGSDEYSWSAASVEQMECYCSALPVGHFTRGLPRFLVGCWSTVGFGLRRRCCWVVYSAVLGRFCKDWSAAAVHSGQHLLSVSLHFMWLRTLTEHWNKYYWGPKCLAPRVHSWTFGGLLSTGDSVNGGNGISRPHPGSVCVSPLHGQCRSSTGTGSIHLRLPHPADRRPHYRWDPLHLGHPYHP